MSGDVVDAAEETVTLHIARGRELFLFRTMPGLRGVVDDIFRHGEYAILSLGDGYSPGDIVDVGANHGAFALFCTVHFPTARVHCFEPLPAHFDLLSGNLKDEERVALYPYGLLDRDARMPIHRGANNPGESTLCSDLEHRGTMAEVDVRRASSALADIDRIGILKLDTEGSEVPILEDLSPRFQAIDFILVEYHRDADRKRIDELLDHEFILFGGRIQRLNTGVLKYVNRRLVAARDPRLLSV